MSRDEVTQVESILSKYPSISAFFGRWLTQEIEKPSHSSLRHVLVGSLASPYGNIVAEKTSRVLETILASAPDHQASLRKKIIQKADQNDFEALWFELEIYALFLEHGHIVEIEPLGRKRKGPDLRTTIGAYPTYIEAKKLRHDAETARLWKTGGTWSRTRTAADLNRREWELYNRYLVTNQFPGDGMHILVTDTSKQGRSDTLMLRAWQYYSEHLNERGISHHPIHALIMCRRQKGNYVSWLHNLTTGVIVLPNENSPLPDDVARYVAMVFQAGQ